MMQSAHLFFLVVVLFFGKFQTAYAGNSNGDGCIELANQFHKRLLVKNKLYLLPNGISVENYRIHTLTEYKERAKNVSAKVRLPEFTLPRLEIEAQKTWEGVFGPRLLNSILPDGVSFVSHALIGASEEGLVKTGSSQMIHLRARLPDGSATNIGINATAIHDNISRKLHGIVREDAEAIVLFIHGGGTRTTGHHVATQMLGYFDNKKVDVVSLDLPWHGEGSRGSFGSAQEINEHIRSFIETYLAPSGKPVFLSGHSMGGVAADTYLRMYPNDNLVKAVISLSTVADSVPGGTLGEKLARDYAVANLNKNNQKIPDSERNLSESLARSGKISPTCGMFCGIYMSGVNWKLPVDHGAHYLPSLYIIGEGDALYQGHEKAFEAGVRQLKNSELVVYKPSRDIKDVDGNNIVDIGHLIFDHKIDIAFKPHVSEIKKNVIYEGRFSLKSDIVTEAQVDEMIKKGDIIIEKGFKAADIKSPETFVRMRLFIEKILGKSLNSSNEQKAPLLQVIKAYANNMVFREFAREFVYQQFKATPKVEALGKKLADLEKEIKVLVHAQQKNGQLSDEQQKLLIRLKNEKAIDQAILSGNVLAENGRPVVGERQNKYIEISNEKKNLRLSIRELRLEKEKLKEEYSHIALQKVRIEKFITQEPLQFTSRVIKKLADRKEAIFKILMEQDNQVRDLVDEYIVSNQKRNSLSKNFFDNLPDEIERAFERYHHLALLYKESDRKLQRALFDEARRNMITGKNKAFVVDQAKIRHDLVIKEASLLSKLERIENENALLAKKEFELNLAHRELTGNEYFDLEQFTIESLLSRPLDQSKDNLKAINSLLQRIWTEWQYMWADRIGEAETSLY